MLYTGCTDNLKRRIEQRQSVQVFSTKNKLPVEIQTYIVFFNING